MNGGFLVDSNVLVYAYDRSEPEKQRRALALLDRLQLNLAGWISLQILGEFFHAVTRKIAAPLSPAEASVRLERLIRAWPVARVNALVVLEAARGVRAHQFPFWDSQIWATAKLNGIPCVLSEDFADGSRVEGISFLNPLKPGFEVESLGLA